MLCPNCGAEFEDGRLACPNCAADVPPSPGLFRRIVDSLFRSGRRTVRMRPTATILMKSVLKAQKFVMVDEATGNAQTFESLADVPTEMRAQIKKALESGTVESRLILPLDGQEQKVHSLDQLPPGLRASVEEALKHPESPLMLSEGSAQKFDSLDELPPELGEVLQVVSRCFSIATRTALSRPFIPCKRCRPACARSMKG